MDESGDMPAEIFDLKKMKVRIEVIGDFEDLKKIRELLQPLAKQ